jgi:hypothetical protein
VLRHLAGGDHTLTVQASNRWGSDARARSFTVVAPPDITQLSFGGEEPVLGGSGYTLASWSGILRVTWTSTGSAAVATCRLDGHTSVCRKGDTLELEPGVHTFRLMLANAAGSDSRTVRITVTL